MPTPQDLFVDAPCPGACPLRIVSPQSLAAWMADAPRPQAQWVRRNGFKAGADSILAVPGDRRDAHRYLRALEEVLIPAVAGYGIQAARVERLAGIWVGDE